MKKFRIIAILMIAALVAGCSGQIHDQVAEYDGHRHDEELLLVSYSAYFELFAEATPFSVGAKSDILAHFTRLADFKPIDASNITVTISINGKETASSHGHSHDEGIYHFSVIPDVAGKGKITFGIEKGGNQSVIEADIVVYDDEREASEAAAEQELSSLNTVAFTKEQSWKIDFATEPAGEEPFGRIIKATAQILPAQSDEWVVVAKSGGIVIFSGANTVEGKPVSSGQALFSIESGDMAENNMNVRYGEAAAEYSRAKAEYERKKELATDRIVSESELLRVRTEFINAETVYNSLLKNFSSGGENVTAPVSGFVAQVLVRNGEFVAPGQPVIAVSQNRDLVIKAEVRSKYYPALADIVSANIRIPASGNLYSLEELDGQLLSYGRSTEAGSPLVPVMFRVRNSAGLLPGSFVDIYIVTRSSASVVTIPNEAIVEDMGSLSVFVQLTPELFEKRVVRAGATDGVRTEVTEGVASGERVVSKGAVMLKLAQGSGTLDAHSGHVH